MTVMEYMNAHREDMEPCECVILPDGSVEEPQPSHIKKLGEEATEIVIAAKNPNPNEVKYEISDFLYHMMVLMAEKDVTWEEITTELANR